MMAQDEEEEAGTVCPICFESFETEKEFSVTNSSRRRQDDIHKAADDKGLTTIENEKNEGSGVDFDDPELGTIEPWSPGTGSPTHGETTTTATTASAPAGSDHDDVENNENDKSGAKKKQGPTANPPFQLTCQHKFCRACLLTHASHAVQTKQIPLQCPEIACREPIVDGTLVRLLEECDDKDLVQQVERLQVLAENPEKVPCTRCPALVSVLPLDGGGGGPDDLQCQACGHSFCRWHGDMHPGLTCAAFGNTERGRQLRQSEEALNQFTKPCSRCGALLQKANGCDYVICGHCRGDFCYKCGTHVHLQGDTFRRCTQCRSTYHNQIQVPMACGCLFMFVLALFSVTLVVAWPAVAGVVILFTGCCGCFFRCGRRMDPSAAASPDAATAPRRRRRSYQPLRGILAVVVILFLPLVMLADGLYTTLSGNQEGFLEGLLPEFSSKAEEIPAMELSPSANMTTTAQAAAAAPLEDEEASPVSSAAETVAENVLVVETEGAADIESGQGQPVESSSP